MLAADTPLQIGSIRLNGLAPRAYLRFVTERIAKYPANRVANLISVSTARWY